MHQPNLSVIITCYFEERSIDEFYSRLRKTLDGCGRSFEIVFVNDGSTDGTWERLKDIHARSTKVTVADLFANSGQLAAMTAGITLASGENMAFIDSDLQLDPEELTTLLARFDEGYDVVSGARIARQDSVFRRIPSYFANKIMQRMTRAPFTDFGCTFKVYRGGLMRSYELGPRRVLNVPDVIRSANRCKEVGVTHHPRRYGSSGWTLRKLFRYNLDNLLGYSEGLFQYLSVVAFAIMVVTFIRVALAWVLPGSILSKVTMGLVLNAMLLSSAFLLGTIAIIGEYVLRLHNRLQRAPAYAFRHLLPARPESDVTGVEAQ